ncbi:hypothetical protein PSN01_04924 [Micromonospora saelicesensis]|nr:hypothetical protein PSN01_04924 [Micromonospora saelicesensis]
MPVRVTLGSPGIVARPKSVSTTRPSSPSNTLPGFTSRCMTPALCAALSAPSTPRPISTVRATETGPSSARVSCNDFDATYSMTIHGSPSVRSTSKMRTTLAWLSRAMARASRNERSRISRRSSSVRPGGGTNSLMATSRCSTSSRAFHTRPMPPWPSGDRSRYRSATSWGSAFDIGETVPGPADAHTAGTPLCASRYFAPRTLSACLPKSPCSGSSAACPPPRSWPLWWGRSSSEPVRPPPPSRRRSPPGRAAVDPAAPAGGAPPACPANPRPAARGLPRWR